MSWKTGTVRVANAPLREAFLRSGLTAGQVAVRMGMLHSKSGSGDGTRLQRSLGLKPSTDSAGYTSTCSTISTERAVALCNVLGADFDDLYPPETRLPPQTGVASCADCGTSLLVPVADHLCGLCREERECAA